MANFVDLDSEYRDRETYPNENDYQLGPGQVETWFRSARSVRAFPQGPNTQPLEFATTVKLLYLQIPYTEELAAIPRVYVNFRSQKYKDIHLINAIDGRQPTAKFVCVFDRVQSDTNDDPLWIHYRCLMEQTMRFERGSPVVFQITTRDGNVLPQTDTNVPVDPDPSRQTLCTFEITPYIRDGDYDEHMVTTLVT